MCYWLVILWSLIEVNSKFLEYECHPKKKNQCKPINQSITINEITCYLTWESKDNYASKLFKKICC